MADAISITGLGLICAIGNDVPSVLASLRSKTSGIGKLRYLPSTHTEIPVGEVQLSTAEMLERLGVPDEEVPICRTSAMGAIAVREALSDAGIRDLAGKRVVLISGTTVGVMDVTERMYEHLRTDPKIPHGNECGKSTIDIARLAGIPDATCCTISTACSSALNSIMLGAEMLLRDEADIVIAGGSEAMSKYHLNGFNSLMILDRERCRPYDDTRAGLNLGEGAGFVVLEKNAGARTRAYVNGYANRCDAYHQTATSPDGDGAFYAMTATLKSAELTPADIQYINAHGTGTPDNDASEGNAFKRVFGAQLPEMSSTKSYTGHTTSASGSIEVIICVLAMQHNFTPGSLGWSHPIPDGVIPTLGHDGVHLENVMCNAFGFGGNDSSMILGQHPHTPGGSGFDRKRYGVRQIAQDRVDTVEDLLNLKDFYTPMESRRMCKLMKAALLSAFRTLRKAGIERPDAIITGTPQGMLETSTAFLSDIIFDGEEHLKPTLFMQSTHNTIGSAVAIRLGCHGYNCTYSHGDESAKWALYDAHRIIESGEAETVLVCSFDETVVNGVTEAFYADSVLLQRAPRDE